MPEQKTITDHDEIRKWATERGGQPARVKGTGGRHGPDDPGMLRLDFPGWAGEESLEPIDWDTWFRAFEDNDLALIIEEGRRDGDLSRFNKIIGRDTAARREQGESGAARHD